MPQPFYRRSAGPSDWAGITLRFYAHSLAANERELPQSLGWYTATGPTIMMPPGQRATITNAFSAAASRILGKTVRSAVITLGLPVPSGTEAVQPIEISLQAQGLDAPSRSDGDVLNASALALRNAVLRAFAEVFRPTNSALYVDDLLNAVLGKHRQGAYSASPSEPPRFSYTGNASQPSSTTPPTSDQVALARRQIEAAKALNEYLRSAPASDIYDASHRSKVNQRILQGQRDMGLTGDAVDGKYGRVTRDRMGQLGQTP